MFGIYSDACLLYTSLIRDIVERVLREAVESEKAPFEKHVDPSGIIGIKTSTVKCEPFEQDGVALKDLVTLEEAPRMGAGVMELDHTSFEWTLTYDEYDMVIEGELEIEIDGRIVRGGPGAVSYTHLDVYKRQLEGHHRSDPARRAACVRA